MLKKRLPSCLRFLIMMQAWFTSVNMSCFYGPRNFNIINSMMNGNTVVKKLKIITVNMTLPIFGRVMKICGVYRLWQELSVDEYKSREIPCWLDLLRTHLLTGSFMVQMQWTTFPLQSLQSPWHSSVSKSSHTATLLHKFKSTGLLFNLKTVCGSLQCRWDVYLFVSKYILIGSRKTHALNSVMAFVKKSSLGRKYYFQEYDLWFISYV